MSSPVLTSAEMRAMHSINMMGCSKEFDAMIAQKKEGKMSTPAIRDALESCASKNFQATSEKCGDTMSDLVACYSKNKKQFIKCKSLKTSLEECWAQHVM
eukprot:CAMPEP_0202458278 /NCGR_PEP_ID=MMETSP1360-20130828/23908_1 /ASSEMBLY_ACC=CAM_ASM_000848 /TAXON_ID=515479 /ORGANISM="Licmophora paradoxa, Strain CCMP2313" /LENGTH=99 /DNA_ID=CAMNT_0049078747 /DNA_START=47 /DNA_END=346 /DNA_ORIENTATION=+